MSIATGERVYHFDLHIVVPVPFHSCRLQVNLALAQLLALLDPNADTDASFIRFQARRCSPGLRYPKGDL